MNEYDEKAYSAKAKTLRDIVSDTGDVLNETCKILEEIVGTMPQAQSGAEPVAGPSIEPPATCMIDQLKSSIQTNGLLAQRVRGLARALADRI